LRFAIAPAQCAALNAPGKIVLYFIAVFVLGAMLAPPLFWGAENLRPVAEKRGWMKYETKKDGTRGEADGWAAFLAPDFAKISNRAVLLAAVLLLWPLFRSLRIRSLAELGLEKNPHRWRDFAVGWGISVAAMAVVGVVLLQLGVYKMKDSPPWGDLVGIAATGVTVGLLEEWMFRGAILGSFRRSMGAWTSLLFVSALFSILHFLKPPETAIPAEQVDWLSGFAVFPHRFAKFSEPLLLLGEFTTLFAFGWVCGWAVFRTRGLALGIGFHAGMILGKFGFNRLTTRPKNMRDLLPWIGTDIAVGLVGVGVVCVVGALLWLYARRRGN
jgi:membrane protease YdiL (CAAX protease family)